MGRKVEGGTSWAEVSAVACQYQLQAGDRVLVATANFSFDFLVAS